MTETTAPEALTLHLPHLRMSALAWGPADGRLAVCLHGFPDSAWSWEQLAPMLADRGFRVVAPFTRGYHPTDLAADGDYNVSALMYDAIELHRHLGGGDDAVVIGHDWGAFTANALAAYPDSPFGEHIVMSVPSIGAMTVKRHSPSTELALAGRQARMSWYIMFFQLPAVPERVLGRVIPKLWRDWSAPGFDVAKGVADTLAALPGKAHRRAAVSYYRALARPGRPDPRYAHLHPYRFTLPIRPVLHIQGRRDGAIQIGYSDFLAQVLPDGSNVAILDAGHFIQAEQPGAVLDAVLAHLG